MASSFPEVSRRFLKGSLPWRPGGVFWQHQSSMASSFPNVSQRFLNLAPWRHILAILWPRISQKFPQGSSKVPQPGAPEAYFSNIMASSFPKVSRRFLKGSSTWRPGGILWQYYDFKFSKGFPKVPQGFLNLAPRRHTLAISCPRVSQKFSEGSPKVPGPGAPEAYCTCTSIMAPSFPKAPRSCLLYTSPSPRDRG